MSIELGYIFKIVQTWTSLPLCAAFGLTGSYLINVIQNNVNVTFTSLIDIVARK